MRCVRSAKVEDFPSVNAICAEIYDTVVNRAHFNWSPDIFALELQQVETLLVESDGRIVSFLCYRDLHDLYEISVLATRLSKQKHSFQTILVQHLQELAAKQRKYVLLEVHPENIGAVALYKKMGFILFHRRKQYYSDGADALVMKWVG